MLVSSMVTVAVGVSTSTTASAATSLPSVSGVTPDFGVPAGGTPVTISGSGFTGATAVDFGSTPATSFTVASDTSITATSPAGTGIVDVTVTTPSGTSPVNAPADQFSYDLGSITGTVTDVTSGSGVSGICVVVNGTGPSGQFAQATTDSTGHYTVSGLPATTYTVEFQTGPTCGSTTAYAAQWYPGVTDPASAGAVSVPAGGSVTVDATMHTVGTLAISGTVTDAASSSGVGDVCVTATDQAGDTGSATTDSTGAYTVSGLPSGTYTVAFADCARPVRYAPQWWQGATSADTSTVISLNASTTGIDAALVKVGSITGTVSAGGTGLAKACVSATDPHGHLVGQTTTGATGTYALTGLPPGTYTVRFSDCHLPASYAGQAYQNATELSGATPVTVNSGAATSGIDATLAAGGSISGTVIDGSGAPLPGICVIANDPYLDFGYGAATTAADGTYTIGGLPAGSYTVRFVDCTHTPARVVTQWFDGVTIASAATPVVVSGTATTTGIDAMMASGGGISGTVSNSSSAVLAGICVSATDGLHTGTATTAADGTYTIGGLAPGQYVVEFSDCSIPAVYTTQWYQGVQIGGYSTPPVTVSSGTTTSGIDASLTVGGSIAGTVTTSSGAGVGGVCVNAWGPQGLETTTTLPGGSYVIGGLPTGGYYVQFVDCSTPPTYAWSWYQNAVPYSNPTPPVSVTAGSTVSGINGTLAVGGTITGTVTSSSGAPLGRVCVEPIDWTSGIGMYLGVATKTAPDGTYRITGMTAGSYDLMFFDCNSPASYISDFWGKHNSGFISVASGATTGSVNMLLSPGGAISGQITDSAGVGLANVCISTGGGNYQTRTTGDGRYTLGGLPAGTYTVSASDCGYPYNSYTPPATAPTATVTVGNTTTGVNATMTGGQSISGTVTRTGGTPLAGICVSASDGLGDHGSTTTAAAGTYTIPALRQGNYVVEFTDCTATPTYTRQWYQGVSTLDTATLVPLQSSSGTGVNATGIDATLTGGGSISGTVTDASTTPLAGICVTATDTTGDTGGATTAADGTYTIADLPTGNYTVKFADCTTPAVHAPDWYDGSPTQAGATPVAVSTGSTASGVNAALYAIPQVASLSPASGATTGGTVVTVTGTGFTGATAVDFGTTPGTNLTVTSDTQLTITAPAGAAGSVPVTVTTPGGTSSTSGPTFTYTTASTGGGGGGGGGGGSTGGGGTTSGTVTAGGSFSSDPTGTLPTSSNPVVITLTSPNAGAVSITKSTTSTAVTGYTTLGIDAQITAPAATASNPLTLTFQVYVGALPAGVVPSDVTVFRDGVAITACTGTPGTASPDPCLAARTVSGTVETLTVLSSHASTWDLQAANVGRIAGPDRYATAVAVSQAEFPSGHASAVVLARGDAYPDALVGTPLAHAMNAPILLTTGTALPAVTATELTRVLPAGGTVYILGGTGAVPASVATQVTNLGYHVVRYGGADRYATALQVAGALGNPGSVLLATGTNFPDALAAGTAAAKIGGVVLLTDGTTLPSADSGYLSAHAQAVYAVGGPASTADPGATALVGSDRYATAVTVAEQFFTNPPSLGVATGTTFPDALSGGPLLAHLGAPVILTAPTAIPSTVGNYLTQVQAVVSTAHLLGGTAALPTAIQSTVAADLGQ